jgi:N-acetylmuramoyl-L-alanine amidase
VSADARRTTLTVVKGRARAVRLRFGVVPLAAVAVAALAAAGVDGVSGAHASAPGTSQARTPAVSALASAALPLKGKIVGIDPGHNGRNYTDPRYLNHQVWNGREWEDCDTTGTVTNSGYTEALFNFRVAEYLRADLIRDGAKVVMTRNTNNGIGPCVTTRSYIINTAHSNVAVDIHADGACPSCRGFSILEPQAYYHSPNGKVIVPSERLGADIKAAMLAGTPMPVSNYYGVNGIIHRNNLAGLNLTKVPKILIEVGNMKNATDARLLTSAKFQQEVARALLAAIIKFLTR